MKKSLEVAGIERGASLLALLATRPPPQPMSLVNIKRRHEKGPNEESPNKNSSKLKSRAKSDPDSLLQVKGIGNIAPDNQVRLGKVCLGLV